MKSYYVYLHKKADTKEIFYVGISCNIKYKRAYSGRGRTDFWKNIVLKHGFEAEIIHENLSKKEAIKKEIELIRKYGRLDLKNGCLCNFTDGGDGHFNPSPETRAKWSKQRTKENNPNWQKVLTPEQRRNHSIALTGIKKSPMSKKHKKAIGNSNKGKTRTQQQKENYRKAMLGKTAKKVKNTETGMIFNSVTEASVFYGKAHSTIIDHLKKMYKNNLPLEYLN